MKYKNLIMVVLSILAPFFTTPAHAIPAPFYSSMISKMEIDPNFNNGPFQNGYMQLDTHEHTVSLVLNYKKYCGTSEICSQMMREPLVIRLPITYSYPTQCGGITYHAEIDRRPTDGALQSIDLTDNSSGVCPNNSGLFPTEAIYTTSNLMRKNTLSRFFGSSLKEIVAVP